ncbi:hypothetical protein [Streptomyces sp. ISL-94]|uniref:DUF7739 domain-containing protein n=1 Tax=Streptomyces sp. ISL-94 TaxID=2819190 RepID=UPI001BEA2C97|nr:hypothetical protein [Streptomyces sp. ISL-94]MBT2477624.1 hypothetical protein [Streptomyces sp. ISL-94]
MGINISHGSNPWGQERLSYTSHANLGKQIAHVLTSSDWRKIQHLFTGRLPDDLLISPAQAGQIADVFAKAAQHPKMPRDWADTVRRWSAAGYRASQNGEPWSWS